MAPRGGTVFRTLTAISLALALGCPSSHDPTAEPEPSEPTRPTRPEPPAGRSESALVGPAGGTLALGDLTLAIPEGALEAPVEITITATDEPTPERFGAYSRVYRFAPEGLSFARPARVALPFAGDPTLATVFWTLAGSESYTALPTRTEGALAVAEVQHFSQAFVGTACEGADCCRRATGELDLLLLVDSSNSMAEEQVSLAREIPALVRAFATGDVDGDGTQDFPAVASLQVATITPDMGTGGHLVPTCSEPTFGDDGVLRTEGNTAVAGCRAAYPSFLSFEAESGADAGAFATDVSCVAQVGTNGCGFEQQLEAGLKAVTASTAATTFHAGTAGHADGANAGFLRDDAVLTLVNLTDENDCSAADPALFDVDSPRYVGDLNLRCFEYPEAVHPVSRYVEGLLDAKGGDGSRLVFANIAGIPADLEGAPADVILADPRMQERLDPAMPNRLVPSCDAPGGVAMPPRRLVETGAGLEERGAAVVDASLCREGVSDAVGQILARVADRVAGRCE
ncbi:MAG: hypothetical protein CMH59_25670 [Myxococcales bacterium]|nr:hypothetical protein [Myxococcales bacterium]